jgi:hypothetical protein
VKAMGYESISGVAANSRFLHCAYDSLRESYASVGMTILIGMTELRGSA